MAPKKGSSTTKHTTRTLLRTRRSLVEGIELTANSEEVGQSGVQLEQFWNIFKAVPPTK